MKDLIIIILFMFLLFYMLNKLIKIEDEQHDKRLKNDIEKTKIIIEELKK